MSHKILYMNLSYEKVISYILNSLLCVIADDNPVILTVQALTCSRRCYSDSQLDVTHFRLINNLNQMIRILVSIF